MLYHHKPGTLIAWSIQKFESLDRRYIDKCHTKSIRLIVKSVNREFFRQDLKTATFHFRITEQFT